MMDTSVETQCFTQRERGKKHIKKDNLLYECIILKYPF